MSYLVFHLSKYKTFNIVVLQRHNQRENKNYSNQDIDKNMSNLNFDLVNLLLICTLVSFQWI